MTTAASRPRRPVDSRASPAAANENARLLSVVLRLALRTDDDGHWQCAECLRGDWNRLMIQHAPGCILWGHSRAELAALDAFEIKQGEVI